MSKMDYMTRARVETIVELSDSLLKEALDAIERHGESDPHVEAILLSAFSMAIKELNKADPTFSSKMIKMLSN